MLARSGSEMLREPARKVAKAIGRGETPAHAAYVHGRLGDATEQRIHFTNLDPHGFERPLG
jgi:hypothetical protein